MKPLVDILFPSQHPIAKAMLYDPDRFIANAIGVRPIEEIGFIVGVLEDQSPESKKDRLRRITHGLVTHDRVLTLYPRG